MASYGMLRHVRTDVSEELSASFIRVTRISELGKLAVNSNPDDSCPTDVGGANSSETSVLTRETRRNIPKGAIIHSHRREHLKFDIFILYSGLFYIININFHKKLISKYL
jgi:hypothetical protein